MNRPGVLAAGATWTRSGRGAQLRPAPRLPEQARPRLAGHGLRPERSLLRRPRLFIFDEATSALDSITEQEVTASLREVSGSTQHIVILIAHRLSTVLHIGAIAMELDRPLKWDPAPEKFNDPKANALRQRPRRDWQRAVAKA